MQEQLKTLLDKISSGETMMIKTIEGKLEPIEGGKEGKIVDAKQEVMELLFGEPVLSRKNKQYWNTLTSLDAPKQKRKYTRRKKAGE